MAGKLGRAIYGGMGGGKSVAQDMFEQSLGRVHRLGTPPAIAHISIDELTDVDQHLRDALLYGQGANIQQVPKIPAIERHTDAEMVMEMIRRGYAVMKLPADGGPPEALRK